MNSAAVRTTHPFDRPNAPWAPARPPLRYFAYTALDAVVLASVERGPFPATGVVRLVCPWTEGRAISKAGVPFLQFEPVDSTDDATDPTRALWEAITADSGIEVTHRSTGDRWLEQAKAFADPCLAAAPVDPFERLTGRRVSYLDGVGARLYWSFGLSVEAVEKLLDARYMPGRSLWPAGYDADRLADAERIRDEQTKAAADAAEAVKVESLRPRSLADVGAEAVAVRCDSPAPDHAPWQGAALSWSRDGEDFYVMRKLPGIALPEYRDRGEALRVCESTELVPPGFTSVPDVTAGYLAFARYMRRYSPKGLDLLRVREWSDRGLERGRELCAENAATLLNATRAFLWPYLCEVLVRGLSIYPPTAELMIREAMHTEEQRRSPPIRFPDRVTTHSNLGDASIAFETKYRDIDRTVPPMLGVNELFANWCLQAADAGMVSVGELLDAPKSSSKTAKKGNLS